MPSGKVEEFLGAAVERTTLDRNRRHRRWSAKHAWP